MSIQGGDYYPDGYWQQNPQGGFNPPMAPLGGGSLLIIPGYFQDTYFPDRHWTQDYWPEAGGAVPPVVPSGPEADRWVGKATLRRDIPFPRELAYAIRVWVQKQKELRSKLE